MDPITPSKTARPIASWILDSIDRLLDFLGLHRFTGIEEIVYLVIVVVVAFVVGWLVKTLVLAALRKLVKVRNGVVGRELLQMRTLSKCCGIIPPLVFLALFPFAFDDMHKTVVVIERIAGVYALIMFGIGLGAVMDFIFYHYNTHENTRQLPLNGVLNIGKGIMWIVIAICAFSIALDKSPAMLLTGLGAFAAALMLVFKDSILGFVAGIQMSQNDMLHKGDWIVVPGTPANGIVLDVTLTAVKVRNWDNTIVTVPPYTLVSTSFQNWRGMKESGCRRIVKTLVMDLTTVYRISDKEIDDIAAKLPILKEFVANLRSRKLMEQDDGGLTPINGTIETNLGLFRAYCCYYIYNNPEINNTQQILIRLLDATPNGLPLEVYCFTATTDWNKYEAIQSAILEHLSTVCGEFGLAVYSSATLTVTQENDTGAVPYDPSSAALPLSHDIAPGQTPAPKVGTGIPSPSATKDSE